MLFDLATPQPVTLHVTWGQTSPQLASDSDPQKEGFNLLLYLPGSPPFRSPSSKLTTPGLVTG